MSQNENNSEALRARHVRALQNFASAYDANSENGQALRAAIAALTPAAVAGEAVVAVRYRFRVERPDGSGSEWTEWRLANNERDADYGIPTGRPAEIEPLYTAPVVAGEAVRADEYEYRHLSLPNAGGERVWLPWQQFGSGDAFQIRRRALATAGGSAVGDGWVSVADRLPAEYGMYLVYVETQGDLGRERWIDWVSFGHDRATGDSFSPCGGRITHWRAVTAPAARGANP